MTKTQAPSDLFADLTKCVVLFADGACKGNPGPGGWGVVAWLPDKGEIFEAAGRKVPATNNEMELQAAIEALKIAARESKPDRKILLFTDSSYVVQGATAWIFGWRRNDWKKSDGQPVANREFWEAMYEACMRVKGRLEWKHLPGHSGIPGNERVDELASGMAEGSHVEFYRSSIVGYDVELFEGLEEVLDRKEKIAPSGRKSSGSKKASSPNAYYLSFVDGTVGRHKSWAECESRVKGRSGAKFKKVEPGEEAALLKAWGSKN